MLADYTFDASYLVDFIYDANELNPVDVVDIANMKPLWGKGVDESYIVIRGIKVTKNNAMLMARDKNPTLKITLPGGIITMIKFGFSEQKFDALVRDTGYVLIDVLGKCSINEWQGNITPQILIEDFEVLGSCDYYF